MAEGAKLLIDDIDSEFLEDCKRALDNFGGFESYELFAEVFYRAVCLVLQYNATPESLHLYLNELTDKTGKKLECAELEFLYLQVLRFFSGYAFAEITPDGWRGIYHREWNDALISCSPCACDYTAASCECEKVNKMSDGRYDEADEESCSCHSWSHRNLNHLIYPIGESGDFDDLKRRLELLPDDRERLILLIDEKAEYEQMFGGQGTPEPSHENCWDIGFSEKCRIEMERLRMRLELAKEDTQSNAKPEDLFNKWQDFLYETAERVNDSDLSQRDFCFEALRFLSDYPLDTRLYCWKRLVIEQQAEIASGFDGCLEHPIPAAFYDYSLKQVKYLTDLKSLVVDSVQPKPNDEPGLNDRETKGAKLLRSVCPLFASAMPVTQETAWKMMSKFTRKQWAYFADSTSILKSSTKVERARRIEEIGSVTNLRDLFGRQPSNEDKMAVNKVMTLLKADAIKAKNA